MVLEGKRAIVTGGSLGIGRAISLDLAANGADVAFTYRRHGEEAQQVAEKIQERGRKALVLQVDVASFEDAHEIVKKVREEFGGLDIL
ncbi:MAG: SDR family NAD(P)-dependent oxidoreductase, partial [Anaerolineae bacterium]